MTTVARGQAGIMPMGGQVTVEMKFSSAKGQFWAAMNTMKSVGLIKY